MAPPLHTLLAAAGLVLTLACGSSLAADESLARIRKASFAADACRVIAEEAERQALPASFFARLIWRESLFNPAAVSWKGAQGIAQFLPSTAAERGLADPFDAAAALTASARYLTDLKARFGNIGLAAAAYNAGPGRVDAWRQGRGGLPLETQDYVLWITGHPAEDWLRAKTELATLPIADGMEFGKACGKLAARGLTAKLPDRPLKAAAWQRMFAAGLGITRVTASRPGRIRVVIDLTKGPARAKAGKRP
ncbi:lytic transglycosylase domain-containing protein [Aureimonas leprariae]|uniref:Lytic transglycosylase domain-containing protein n=2 Tax=Plantimonas leprariae TaxID=2615207 RepID=A0A7V7TYJ9_9HYPH|nr:lytic transglycosylase domain-containing protein [Aureimonas leprariae]